jgi:hypothetical protein
MPQPHLGRGMKRCPLSGLERFEVFVGLAGLANNLLRIAELLKTPARRLALPSRSHALRPRAVR